MSIFTKDLNAPALETCITVVKQIQHKCRKNKIKIKNEGRIYLWY